MKMSLPISITIFSLLFAGIVSAQTATPSAGESTSDATASPAIKRQEVQEKRVQVQENLQEKRATVRENLQEKREELKTRIQEKREEMREEVKVRREEFKEKAAQIRDTRKRAVVERIDAQLSQINEKHTDQMSEFLVRLSALLDKIESRKEKARLEGKDVTEVETEIGSARSLIEAAKTQVAAQAGNDYTIELGEDEALLRSVVGDGMSNLQRDLRNTRNVVIDAKKAVQDVLGVIKGLGGEEDGQ